MEEKLTHEWEWFSSDCSRMRVPNGWVYCFAVNEREVVHVGGEYGPVASEVLRTNRRVVFVPLDVRQELIMEVARALEKLADEKREG